MTSRQLTYELIADGGTDRALIPILEWALHDMDPSLEILEPVFRKRKAPVQEFLNEHESHSMLVFVHRDAESATLSERAEEFPNPLPEGLVPVIPVKMSEAWLLTDAHAISTAAGKPSTLVQVPPVNSLESIADPKQVLEDLLLLAAGDLRGRRRQRFQASLPSLRASVAGYTKDFSALVNLESFANFQRHLHAANPYGHARQ